MPDTITISRVTLDLLMDAARRDREYVFTVGMKASEIKHRPRVTKAELERLSAAITEAANALTAEQLTLHTFASLH